MNRDEGYTAIMVARVDDCPTPRVPSIKRPCASCGFSCWVQPKALLGVDFVELLGVDPLVTGKATEIPLPRKIVCMRCLAKLTGYGDTLDEALDQAKARRLKRGSRR